MHPKEPESIYSWDDFIEMFGLERKFYKSHEEVNKKMFEDLLEEGKSFKEINETMKEKENNGVSIAISSFKAAAKWLEEDLKIFEEPFDFDE